VVVVGIQPQNRYGSFRKLPFIVVLLFCFLPFGLGILITLYAIFIQVQKNLASNASLTSYISVLLSIACLFLLARAVFLIAKNKSASTEFFPLILISLIGADNVIRTLVTPQNAGDGWFIGLVFAMPLVVIYISHSLEKKPNEEVKS
jgi:hypothetical protein